MNLVDRDLTEYQITQTLTLSRLHAQLEQTRGIRLFTHTQHVDSSRQGESNCLITLWSKQVILRSIFRSMRCESGLGESVERVRGVNPWLIRSMNRICYGCWYLCVYAVCIWKLEQIVDIPVPQIVEEITEVSKSLIVCNSILNLYFEEIEVFPA